MEEKKDHYLVITDVNSRQYNYLIGETGVKIEKNPDEYFVVLSEQTNMQEFNQLLKNSDTSFLVNGTDCFLVKHLVTVQYRVIPAE